TPAAHKMSWSEVQDVQPSPSFTLSSYLHAPSRTPSASPFSPASFRMSDRATPDHGYYHIHSIEQDFCSNFSCCGLALADMHQLLDHFEEAHVVVIGQDGRPIYPRSLSGCSPSPSPPTRKGVSRFVVSYPQPNPPLPDTALPGAMHIHSRGSTPPNDDVLADFDPFETDVCMSDASTSTPPSSVFSSPDPNVPVCLPPALLTMPSSPTLQLLDWSMRTGEGSSDAVSGMKRKHGSVRGVSIEVNGRKTKVVDSPTRKRDCREKMYKCPHPGCSKAYLNPNGLKYHLEKGTCTVDVNPTAPSHVRTHSPDRTVLPSTMPFRVSN
ncbi:hypothetical protein EUX98_g4703, partial [Antrodiella citrinella]